jgi:hypothetical protein
MRSHGCLFLLIIYWKKSDFMSGFTIGIIGGRSMGRWFERFFPRRHTVRIAVDNVTFSGTLAKKSEWYSQFRWVPLIPEQKKSASYEWDQLLMISVHEETILKASSAFSAQVSHSRYSGLLPVPCRQNVMFAPQRKDCWVPEGSLRKRGIVTRMIRCA